MPSNYAAMSNRELDARCAELMGWVRDGKYWCVPVNGVPLRGVTQIDGPGKFIPYAYSTDLNDARELEREIDRRGLQYEYARGLLCACGSQVTSMSMLMAGDLFLIATATARQRSEAFCRAMEARSGGPDAH